ncbi:MAG: diphosphomevalonate decarboxylase [Flavobacteriaceae bacterium]|nr:diphosphomevalonate decarboxylase [Flavobacteriaceae bacterium]|tara:strand:- start:35910 stop:36983 length:1074 start_codon:yes stop_codon:yes gene_type:complete
MTEKDFVFKKIELITGKITWESPSNIALVKYWGKYNEQLPKNPSLSFTLSRCKTKTTIKYRPKEEKEKGNFLFKFNGKSMPSFHQKIDRFIKIVESYIHVVKFHFFEIDSYNSFPHSTGVASSASSMSSLALCFMEIERKLNNQISDSYFLKKAAFLSRLGSGSATRSIQGPIVTWGSSSSFDGSSSLYGTLINSKIADVFKTYQNTILLIDINQKKISSSYGHQLMKEHPYAKCRYIQANKNINTFKKILSNGDLSEFIRIVELEALSLHAMMLTSSPQYILMKPNTISAIDEILRYRKVTSIPICYTLDAGANIHLLYPKSYKEKAMIFIKEKLLKFCNSGEFIDDYVGEGAKKI